MADTDIAVIDAGLGESDKTRMGLGRAKRVCSWNSIFIGIQYEFGAAWGLVLWCFSLPDLGFQHLFLLSAGRGNIRQSGGHRHVRDTGRGI